MTHSALGRNTETIHSFICQKPPRLLYNNNIIIDFLADLLFFAKSAMNPLANLNFQNGDKEFFVVEEISIKIFVHLMVHDMVYLLYNIYSCKILYLEFVSFFKLIH